MKYKISDNITVVTCYDDKDFFAVKVEVSGTADDGEEYTVTFETSKKELDKIVEKLDNLVTNHMV